MFRKYLLKYMLAVAKRYYAYRLLFWAVVLGVVCYIVTMDFPMEEAALPVHGHFTILVQLTLSISCAALLLYLFMLFDVIMLLFAARDKEISFKQIHFFIMPALGNSCNYTEELHELLKACDPDTVKVTRYERDNTVEVKITIKGTEYTLAKYAADLEQYEPVIDTCKFLSDNHPQWRQSINYHVFSGY